MAEQEFLDIVGHIPELGICTAYEIKKGEEIAVMRVNFRLEDGQVVMDAEATDKLGYNPRIPSEDEINYAIGCFRNSKSKQKIGA
ncbi:MAG: hypothetical protein HYW26_05745 [Candidatus Aenigmarchaeota archaeon]|nr:hypothetical protein [Candidatus Aenigmarchaeota archaeon]